MTKKMLIFVIMILGFIVLLQGNVFASKTLPEAINGVITLTEDVELESNVVIPKGETVVLDLNGYTISQQYTQTAAYSMINNKGTLTIKDSVGNGKISFEDTGVGGEYVSNTIGNSGTLIINGGTIENISSITVAKNGYPHAIDTSGKLVVNGGTVFSKNYTAIRVWCTTDDDTSVEINEGATIINAIDMHNVNVDANKGTLTINGGTFKVTNGTLRATTNSVRLVNFGSDYDEIDVIIKDGNFAGGFVVSGSTAAELTDVIKVSGGKFTAENFDVTPYLTENLKVNSDGTVSCAHKDGLTYHKEVAATYKDEGTKEYWECGVCKEIFADSNAVTQITDIANLVIPKLVEVINNNANITTNAFDEAISNAENSNSTIVEIPVVETQQTVTSVTVPVSSLTDVANANKDLLIETSELVVILDTKAIKEIVEQSGTVTDIKVEVAKVEDTVLNKEQKESIKDKEVTCIFLAEIIANGKTISDFGGGKVTVQIPFIPEEGTKESDYKVIYIADDGNVTDIVTKYIDGALIVELEHFSEYAIVKVAAIKDEEKDDDKDDDSLDGTKDDKTDKNAAEGELVENEADKSITGAAKDETTNVVQTGDNIYLYVSILGICVIGIVIIVKRKFGQK